MRRVSLGNKISRREVDQAYRPGIRLSGPRADSMLELDRVTTWIISTASAREGEYLFPVYYGTSLTPLRRICAMMLGIQRATASHVLECYSLLYRTIFKNSRRNLMSGILRPRYRTRDIDLAFQRLFQSPVVDNESMEKLHQEWPVDLQGRVIVRGRADGVRFAAREKSVPRT